MSQYEDPIIKSLIDYFTAEGPKEMRGNWYFGDPVIIPKSMLPAGFITKDGTEIASGSSAEDDSRINLVINVAYDLTRDFNKSRSSTGTNSLYDVVEARQEGTGDLKPASLAYILRKHYTLIEGKAWLDVDTPLRLEYGIGVEKRGPGIFTVEAVIRTQVRHSQISPAKEN